MNKILNLSLWGESHNEYIGATITNIAPGIKIDLEFIKKQLDKRRGNKSLATLRQEEDDFNFVSGYYKGFTTGEPLTVIIKNKDINSSFYLENRFIPRPSHADYTSYVKSFGFNDNRGGGHHSGRLTTPLVILGAIALQILKSKNIEVFTHILKIKDIKDQSLLNNKVDIRSLKVNDESFPVIDSKVEQKMKDLIIKVRQENDSVGAILESGIYNLEPGFGGAYFSSLKACIGQAILSIPAIKGVEFGLGFDYINFNGSNVNDLFEVVEDKIRTTTNNNGGINGGISNGMPIIIKSVVKPTPSIGLTQQSVNMQNLTNEVIKIKGRHDPCIASRLAVVIDSVLALTLLDEICFKEGILWMR